MRDLPSNTKLIKIDKFERHEVEKNLTLLGLIVFENRIKSETKPVIEKLHRAKVRTIMVTGNFFHLCKVKKILKDSLDSISSPSPSVKIQIIGKKVCLRCKVKTLLGLVNKHLKTKILLTSPSNVLPYYLK